MTLRVSRGVLAVVIIVALLGVGIYAGLYYLLKRAEPLVMPEQCSVTTPLGGLDLDIEQARIASIIAGVAARRRLPERAVQIAYVTAIQESKIFNLPYGDRDSVGVFQQRPSQGWGTKKQLLDTVYATRKFFAALEKVKGYRKMPLDKAAQAVQRSADGSAYAGHQRDAEILSAAFTGRVPRAVHCVYPQSATPVPARVDAARRLLVRVLGEAGVRSDQVGERSTGSGLRIDAPNSRRGWLIATFAVAHAQQYGLSHVRYDGVVWRADQGDDGWRTDSAATSRRIEVAVAGPPARVPAASTRASSAAGRRRSRAAARS
ncbi:hypothetical protein AB0K60_22680 [Thermopolyspora sp. NPDC052614]|uniref:hypothetical protein n=1 Tax=Thermopolyspora sp. NPDC052614 TaxID=3155682 RepID=UPI0034129643